MIIRALIVDDEPLARERLRRLLGARRDILIAGEASDGVEAAALVAQEQPDVLFLDISMPRAGAFDLLASLEHPPSVIFTTAHAEYAVQAFEQNAIDYLLKPIGEERLERALARLRRTLRHPNFAARSRTATRLPRRIAVRNRSEVVFVSVADIAWLGAEGNYCRVHVGGRSYLVRELISSFTRRLDPGQFLRVHRSTVVNLENVAKLVGNHDDGYSVVLNDGTTLRIGSSYSDVVTRLLDPRG
jgi:DNA-binding LytR/AlgR family response regulator